MNRLNLQMPQGVDRDETTYSNTHGRFVIQPLERGFGVTIGNSLRRVLLSSLQGAAITHIKLEGVQHEFSAIPGVVEDVSETVLNLKQVRLKLLNKRPDRVLVQMKGPGVFKAGDIQKFSADLEVLNPEQVIATLNICSVDLHSGTIVLTRNNPAPIFFAHGEKADCLAAPSEPLGTSRDIRPVITEFEIEAGLTIVVYTDGLVHAGKRRGQPMDACEVIRSLLEEQDPSPQELADSLLAHAVQQDDGRPADDISVVVLRVFRHDGDDVRRMNIRLPISR